MPETTSNTRRQGQQKGQRVGRSPGAPPFKFEMPDEVLTILHGNDRARRELKSSGVTSREIDAILFPRDRSPLRDLRQASDSPDLAQLVKHLKNALDVASILPARDQKMIALVLKRSHAALLRAEQISAQLKIGGPRQYPIPNHDWWNRTPAENAESGRLSRAGFIADRSAALYRVIVAHIPPKRRQQLGSRQVSYNQRALDLTAKILNGAYHWYGLPLLTAKHIASYIQRRIRHRDGGPQVITAIRRTRQR